LTGGDFEPPDVGQDSDEVPANVLEFVRPPRPTTADLRAELAARADERYTDAVAAREAAAEAEAQARAKRRWSRSMAAIAEEIIELGKQPLWRWGFSTLDREAPVPVGSLVYLLGATGRGKSSFMAQVAVHHAIHTGPALIVSAELVGAIMGSRIVSQTGVDSWINVVTGKVEPDRVREAVAPLTRMRLADGVGASWAADLRDEIVAMQAEFPGEQLLVALDYLQLLRMEGREIRERVLGASAILRELAKEFQCVIVAIAKMGRAASKAARDGTAVGIDGTEGGAEAGIELDAIVQLSLGAMKPEDENEPKGPQVVDLSINKTRFGAADMVVPFRFQGAQGVFEDLDQAVPAADRRQEASERKKADREAAKAAKLEDAIAEHLEGATQPLTCNEVAGSVDKGGIGGRKGDNLRAIEAGIAKGRFVRVESLDGDHPSTKYVMHAGNARHLGYKPPPDSAPKAPWRRP
jgi:hypothetical protein